MTQREWVKAQLEKGDSLTSLQAFEQRHITRLASIVHRLRTDGMDINSDKVGVKYATYSM